MERGAVFSIHGQLDIRGRRTHGGSNGSFERRVDFFTRGKQPALGDGIGGGQRITDARVYSTLAGGEPAQAVLRLRGHAEHAATYAGPRRQPDPLRPCPDRDGSGPSAPSRQGFGGAVARPVHRATRLTRDGGRGIPARNVCHLGRPVRDPADPAVRSLRPAGGSLPRALGQGVPPGRADPGQAGRARCAGGPPGAGVRLDPARPGRGARAAACSYPSAFPCVLPNPPRLDGDVPKP